MATSALRAVTQTGIRISPVVAITLAAFVLCFGLGIIDLVQAWIRIPDSAHGLLIAPISAWLAWRRGIVDNPRQSLWMGSAIIAVSVTFYILGRTAGVETVPRAALFLAMVGTTVWYAGWRQVIAWWLPFVLFGLTIPMPESIIAAVTLPLQGVAADMGAALLSSRNIPVLLSGNIIRLPGHMLFVSEACSGLRSLTALVSMAILVGALFLKHPVTRVLMLASAVGLAIVVNGIRVFMTGFLVYFIDPKLGEGFMHLTEGYLLFLVSLGILAGLTWLYMKGEQRLFKVRR
jgi:exosortase